jgi:hypothetical protein
MFTRFSKTMTYTPETVDTSIKYWKNNQIKKDIKNRKKTNEKDCNIHLLMETKQNCSLIYRKKGG